MDASELKKYLDLIVNKKTMGYQILHPENYYLGFFDFNNGEINWDCNVAKKRTIQIAPDGGVYWCSKLNKISPYKFTEMNLEDFLKFKIQLGSIIKKCNKKCYSGCAYYSYYYHQHPLKFLQNVFLPAISRKRIFHIKNQL